MSQGIKPVKNFHFANVTSRGSKVMQENYKGKFTRTQIRKQAQLISDKIAEKGGQGTIEVVLYYEKFAYPWRQGTFTKAGAPVDLYSLDDYPDNAEEDPKFYPKFVIYYNKGAPAQGGKTGDGKNDCLWDILNVAFKKKNPWTTPASLKKFLKFDLPLERNQPIDICHIKAIEEKLVKKCNTKINLRGDHVIPSTYDIQLELNIKIIKGHYTLDKTGREKIQDVIEYKEKKPLLYKFDKTTKPVTILTYGGKEKRISLEEFDNIQHKKKHESKYILILSKKDTKMTMKEEWENWITEATEIKNISKYEINPFKTGYAKKTALYLIDKLTLNLPLSKHLRKHIELQITLFLTL